jgi:hypothetical protein
MNVDEVIQETTPLRSLFTYMLFKVTIIVRVKKVDLQSTNDNMLHLMQFF